MKSFYGEWIFLDFTHTPVHIFSITISWQQVCLAFPQLGSSILRLNSPNKILKIYGIEKFFSERWRERN